MSEDPVRQALYSIEHSLNLADAARHTLATVMEDLGDSAPANTVACVMCTLDTAAKDGRAGFGVVWKAMNEKAA